ncbi:peptidylprolyl isomerase [Oceanomicrobium pacificus]|uniref:Peptidyl-prolyl cis-trans isomerase n=1 Tax=Oceanomicrobium pacificus TaxID=2692916 RepID=A0A6B0TXL3_9RHOB|nr:peptidylprolyl isomerase [Oceanomicrobium pacificus]MXU65874.1 peptidylprolyl isomerase [Oceanomicrobium pacificus]
MIRRGFLALAAAATLLGGAGAALAQNAEDILVIEVAGEAEGTVEIELLPDVAPAHVERIKKLARSGEYDGVAFHRVIDGFMAQTGDVEFGHVGDYAGNLAGRGGSVLADLPAEFSDIAYQKGTVGMARSQSPNSANSQFFIMFDDAPFLNGQYTVFGKVIRGQSVIDAIKRGDQANNGMVTGKPDYMKKVWIKSDL